MVSLTSRLESNNNDKKSLRAFEFGEALGKVRCFLEQRLEFSVGDLAVSRD